MSDLISRQAAIDKIVETSDEIYKNKQKGATYPHDDFFQGMAYAENIVKQLPPAQPERIKGRWVPADTLCGIKCSNCGYPVDDFCYSIDYIDLEYAPNFCPNCGADMREVTT